MTRRVGFISDPHAGNHKRLSKQLPGGLNSRCVEVLGVIKAAVRRAKELRCEKLFVLGDLFDTDVPSPSIIYAVQEVLTSSLPIVLIPGNHDLTSDAQSHHALAPLTAVSNLSIITAPETEIPVALVPYRSGPTAEWFEDAVAAAATEGNDAQVLAFHAGIIDSDTPPWLAGASGAVHIDTVRRLMDKHGFLAAIAGDWHLRKVWSGVMQCGSLCPTGFDNPGLSGYGTLAVFDYGGGFTVEELPGPRFLKVRSRKEADAALASANMLGHHLYLQVVGDVDTDGIEDGYNEPELTLERVPDDTDVQVAARSAAQVARSADTLVEALDGFVKEMPLEEGVDRARVLDRCREYLR